MNTASLLDFGKYDLTINKVFYRNMVIMAISVAMGLSLLCFVMRWIMYSSTVSSYGDFGMPITPNDPMHYSNAPFTSMLLYMMCSIFLIIFVGCSFHNFRTRQGRINELILPVSNAKKYAWHLIVSIGGGLCVIILSLLAADLINLLLHWIVFGTEHSFSLAKKVFETCTFSLSDTKQIMPTDEMQLLTHVRIFTICSILANIATFIYGNSVKYRFNIIITYGILQGIMTILMFGFIIAMSFVNNNMSTPDSNAFLLGSMKVAIGVTLIVAALGFWRSYKRYCKAQVTTRLNK